MIRIVFAKPSLAILILVVVQIDVIAQGSATQKALNAYAAYANRSGEEISDVVSATFKHYEVLTSKYPDRARYVCPFQMEDYFLSTVNTQAKNLNAANVTAAFQELRIAEKKVDEQCKSLDTYYKLEDYKKDNFASAKTKIEALQPLIASYQLAYNKFRQALEASYEKVRVGTTGPYGSADQRLLTIIQQERTFLDGWKLNFNTQNYSGWSVEKLQASIAMTAANLESLKSAKPALKYPASSMWTNFIEVYSEYLDSKRRVLDEHTYEATKDDQHNNEVYLNLINYFNGTLVADYNTFLQFAERDGYSGLATLRYVPVFDIVQNKEIVKVDVKPFENLPYTPIKIEKQKTSINKPTFEALSEYIEFINETWRQTRSLQSTLVSFNSSAAYFKTLESFERRQPLFLDYSKFQVPYSYYQKVTTSSKSLPPAVSRSLNTQAEVIMNVLKEMDQLGASLDLEVKERRYEKDRLERVYQILEREGELLKIWDEKKEKLYQDVRAVFDAYVPINPESSWQKSGTVLRAVVDLDHDAMFEAKKFYNGDTTVKINIEPIESLSREIISKEYDNLQGIEKLGRYNGNCPYSPYEDVPKTSRQLAEHFQKLTPRKPNTSRYSDPYYNIVYLYNDIVEDYNKFCELSSAVPHLKTIFQPEAFKVQYPDPAKEKKPAVIAKAPSDQDKTTGEISANTQPQTNAEKVENRDALTNTSAHTRDTIYIEKRDTIYIREPNEPLRSMEGYATNNMVLLLDVSGSMNQPDKLPLLKESMLRMLEMMRIEDKVSIIAFASKPKLLLKSTSFKEENKIRKAVSDLSSSGKTDGRSAIKMAYKVADEHYIRGGNNRIILATDGEFPMDEETRKLIQDFAQNDIFLTVFNFGKGMGTTKTLQNLAEAGKGNYAAISRENVDLKLIMEAKAKRSK